MAWFITKADPTLRVQMAGRDDIVFRNAEYRTTDPEEMAALMADPRVTVAEMTHREDTEARVTAVMAQMDAPATEKDAAAAEVAAILDAAVEESGTITEELVRPFAVNLETEQIHDLELTGSRCNIPDEVRAAAIDDSEPPDGWKLYRRLSDARRWNRDAGACDWCLSDGDHDDN